MKAIICVRPNRADDVGSMTTLVYANHDGVELEGDLYLPQGNGPFPVLIAVPGGGWRVCVRAGLQQWGRYLAGRGFGLFAIDYRVATAARKAFPEAVQDVIAAVRFIRGSAAALSLDPQRIGLLGASAGAYLAAMAGLAHDDPAWSAGYPNDTFADVSAEVKVLVAVYGIYDLKAHWEDDLRLNPSAEGNAVRNLIGNDPYEDPQRYFAASPLSHITYAKNQMPVFVTWGTADEIVNPAQSERFVRSLQQARFNVITRQVVGASHFWFSHPLDEPTTDSAQLAPRLSLFLRAL
jgi:acetyl esterase/lipase